VLEDAAQAAGARLGGTAAGALGDVATFSFYPSKNLGAFGDGGAIVTDDDELAELARALRFHGSRDKRTFAHVGYNSRLDELQAALLRVLLPSLDGWAQARDRVGRGYASGPLADVVGHPERPVDALAAWHLYVVTHPRADELVASLAERGIGARSYYRVPVHRQPAMAPYATRTPELPATDELARTNLALPMGPSLSDEQIAEVAEAVVALAGR
jgi:dTDP-4-amino-4,6-dideoxygalactose transaminase